VLEKVVLQAFYKRSVTTRPPTGGVKHGGGDITGCLGFLTLSLAI